MERVHLVTADQDQSVRGDKVPPNHSPVLLARNDASVYIRIRLQTSHIQR